MIAATMQQKPKYRIKRDTFTDEEILGVAKLHVSEVEEGFLSSLGERALAFLYRHITRTGNAVIFAAFSNGDPNPLGFICGTLNCAALYKDFLRSNRIRALTILLPRLLTYRRLKMCFETLVYPSRMAGLPKPEILNFVVHPSRRGTGISDVLFQALMDYFKSEGVTEARIITGGNQRRAQKFYEKKGARRVGFTTIHRGRTALAYVYNLR